jgi:haloalkane dehalogenase
VTSPATQVVRTPDESFSELEGFPYEPRYLEVDGLRIHYVDEGPTDAAPVLLVHGWPAWSYQWRNVIPQLLAAGRRVVAPDLIGFGRSDKPASREEVALSDLVRGLRGFVSTLDLSGATMVCHDWGGLFALPVVAEQPDRFAAVVAVNTLLPTGDRAPGDRFLAWQWSTQAGGDFSAGEVLAQGCGAELADDVLDGYDAPFEGAGEGAGSLDAAARELPMLIPTRPDNPESQVYRETWEVFGSWDKPFVTLWSDAHPVVGGADRFWRDGVPGAAGQPHVVVEEETIYLVEDRPGLVVDAVAGVAF